MMLSCSFSRNTVSHIFTIATKKSTCIKITHRYCIQRFCSNAQSESNTITFTPKHSIQSQPNIPTLQRQYDKNTKTLSYVLTSPETNDIIPRTTDKKQADASNQETKQQQKEHRLTTNALTEYLPSHKKKHKERDREKELKSLEQSLVKKFGSTKDKILKQIKKNYLKQKRQLSEEIMSYLETIPKLQKLRNKFTHDELSKLLLLQQALQISPKQYKKVLKRFPFILKLDIEKEILPKMKALQQVFPNQDTLSIFIRAPNIIEGNTSTWLTRRDKINNLLGIRKDVLQMVISKQPTILFNSIIKTTGPKIRFLCDRVRSKYELECILYTQPSILKVGWGRLARIEFLRSAAVPHKWQTECVDAPPNTKNVLGDNYDDDLEDINDDKKVDKSVLEKRKLDKKKREINMEWHLNRPCVTWNHRQMKYHFPKYIHFLEEFTLRANKSKMWTKRDLQQITSKEMEEIVGAALRKKYVRSKLVGVNWAKKALKQRQNRRSQRIRTKIAKTPQMQKQK